MDFIERFNANLAKIECIEASFYERDLLFSAYYNHLNNLPISLDSKRVMERYGVRFDKKRVVIKDSRLDSDNLPHYKSPNNAKTSNQPSKTSIDSSHATQTKSLHLEDSCLMDSHILTNLGDISIIAKHYTSEIERLLLHSRKILDEIFEKSEISHRLISELLDMLEAKSLSVKSSLDGFVVAFQENLASLERESRDEILHKSQKLLKSLSYHYNQAIKICIKILSINANAALANDLESYINTMISELKKYENFRDS